MGNRRAFFMGRGGVEVCLKKRVMPWSAPDESLKDTKNFLAFLTRKDLAIILPVIEDAGAAAVILLHILRI